MCASVTSMEEFLQQNLFLMPSYYIPLLSLLIFIICLYKILVSNPITTKNKPPSPPKLPIIGNLHQLSPALHRAFLPLSQQYGDLMLLHLGSKPTLVVSSANAVREILKTHDSIFSSRPNSRFINKIFYGAKDVAFAPYDEGWRLRRSICVMELLSNKKVQSFCSIREEETALLVEKIHKNGSSVVNLSEYLLTYTFDILCRVAFGWKYNNSNSNSNSNSKSGLNFKELLHEAMELIGAFSLGYFIPWLSFMDQLNGLNARVEKVAKQLNEIIEEIVEEHKHHLRDQINNVEECDQMNNARNFVDILLEHQRVHKDSLSMDNIKALILDMFAAGTDTTFIVIEWAMAELIKHPEIMREARNEIIKVTGSNERKVYEQDLDKLTYLKAVINEALRLHPPGPLLVFRESMKDVKINGYDIDAGTQVIINAWAIQRDSSFWDEPEEFRPQRFLNKTISFDGKGQDFGLIPFGGGRRICAGKSFAMVIVELVVANLVNEFEWKLPDGVDCENLDMAESVGLNVHKLEPLMVIATSA